MAMANVIYGNKTVSDPQVRTLLERISRLFDSTVTVTSGDRSHVPPGGSRTSHHLLKRAADFHVKGVTDAAVFAALKYLAWDGGVFQIIHHGPHTATSAEHIHIGNYGAPNPKAGFWTEGLTKQTRNIYKKL